MIYIPAYDILINVLNSDTIPKIAYESMGVNILSKEIIESIRKAEANAKKMRADAAHEAKRIVSNAEMQAKSEYESAVASAERDMEEKLALITEQCESLLEKNKAEAEAEAKAEMRTAMRNMDDAVAIIIGELTKNVGK